jgi:hypothetical protein
MEHPETYIVPGEVAVSLDRDAIRARLQWLTLRHKERTRREIGDAGAEDDIGELLRLVEELLAEQEGR